MAAIKRPISASLKAQQLTEARKRVGEVFAVFEAYHRDGSRMVDMREIPAIVRSLGINPSTAQLQVLQQAIAAAASAGAAGSTQPPGPASPPPGPSAAGGAPPASAPAPTPAAPTTSTSSSSGLVAQEQCEGLIAAWLVESREALARDGFHLLMRAFQALDPDARGWLDAEQVKALLMGCGEDALTVDEANAMIDAAADNQGRINYQEYALALATDGRDS